MKTTTKVLAALLLIFSLTNTYAQLTGIKNIPGNYASLDLAIADLNTQGVGAGGVTLNLIAGNPQTAPAGGYVITASGTAANTITIQGNGNTITASAALTVGSVTDALFTIGGGDYITITNFTLQENTANTVGTPAASNNMTEFGVVLARASTTDGAKYNTVSNCTITLRNTTAYTTTIGIYSNARHDYNASFTTTVANSPGGENSYNTFSGNTISGVTSGIVIIGDATNNDQANTVGGASLALGNNITPGPNTSNMLTTYTGYTASSMDAVYMLGNQGATASYNAVTLNTGSTLASNGVYMSTSAAGAYSNTISYNNINMTGAGTTAYAGIQNTSAGNSSSTIFIDNNTVSVVEGSGTTNGITNTAAAGNIIITNNNVTVRNGAATINGVNTAAAGGTVNLSANTIDLSTTGTSSTAQFIGSTSTVSGSITIQNNILKSTNNLTTTSGSVYLINNSNNTNSIVVSGNRTQGTITKSGSGGTFYGYNNFGIATGGSEDIYDNNFSNINLAGTAALYGIRSASGTTPLQGRNIYNDTVSNITSGSGTTYGMYINYCPLATSTVHNNRITGISGTGTVTALAISTSASGATFHDNYISGISSSGVSSIVTGFLINPSTSGTVISHNDTITGISTSGNTAPFVRGIQLSTGANDSVYSDLIYALSASTTTGSAGMSGIYNSGGTTPYIFSNNIYNVDAGTSAGTSTQSVGIYVNAATTGTNIYNNFVSGLSAGSASNVNAVIGINLAATTAISNKVYFNTIALGFAAALTGGANFGVTGILYPSSASPLLDAENNYIYVNATASGTGLNAVIRRNTSTGTANVPPAVTNFTANNNVYYINSGTNNYLYVEATDNTNTVNGYAQAGLTANVVNNIVNDASFNTSCGLYKSFMTGREGGTATESALIAGPATGTFVPTGLTYAESGGLTITTPSITTDFSGNARSNPPDIGALQFGGTGIDISAPAISYAAPANTYCTAPPVINATISDLSGINVVAGTAPRMYYRKSTDNDAFGNYPVDNNAAFNGWKYVEGTGTAPNFSFQPNYSLLQSPVAGGDVIVYFFAAQDLAATPNVGINNNTLAAGYCASSVNFDAAAGPTTGSPSSYTILVTPALSVSPAAPVTSCGTPVQLYVSGNVINVNADLGTPASTTSPNTTASALGPDPMQNYYGGTKQQMLFLASELSAIGMVTGSQISAMTINLAATNGTALQSFTIKMAATAITSISTWETGLTIVFPATSVTPVVGVNTFTFTTPFTWDGTSNVVVEMNYSNNNGGSGSSNTATYSPTAFQSTIFYRADNQTAATMDAYVGSPSYSYTTRNNTTFTYSTLLPATWTPQGNAFLDALTTNPYTGGPTDTLYVKPENNTQYAVTVSLGACADTLPVVVSVNSGNNSLAGTTGLTETDSALVSTATEVHYSDCDLMTTITPAGASPIAGNTNVSVTLDAAVNSYNSQPYLQRHFDIVPDANLNSATGDITLYAYQSDFDAFNAVAGPAGYPLLPTGAVDNGNVRITEFHGTGTAPGNYTGAEELITPAVAWDAANNWWVMTFSITGSGGFYIHTNVLNGALDIKVADISAVNVGQRNRLDWRTATEVEGALFTIERSTDGSHFTALGDVNAKGQPASYTWWDEKPAYGINYYRLKLTEPSGNTSYTRVVSATVKNSNAFTVDAYPNPVLTSVTVNIHGTQDANALISLTDVTGKVLKQLYPLSDKVDVDMTGLASGIYMIKYTDNSHAETIRVNKQ